MGVNVPFTGQLVLYWDRTSALPIVVVESHTEVAACNWKPNFLPHWATEAFINLTTYWAAIYHFYISAKSQTFSLPCILHLFGFDIAFTILNRLYLFIYLWFYVAFNTVQVISGRVVGRAEETSTYSWSRFCTVNC